MELSVPLFCAFLLLYTVITYIYIVSDGEATPKHEEKALELLVRKRPLPKGLIRLAADHPLILNVVIKIQFLLTFQNVRDPTTDTPMGHDPQQMQEIISILHVHRIRLDGVVDVIRNLDHLLQDVILDHVKIHLVNKTNTDKVTLKFILFFSLH